MVLAGKERKAGEMGEVFNLTQEGSSISKGDFILVDLTGRVKNGEVFETTSKDVAEKEGIYDEGQAYEPKLVIVGEGWILPKLDEVLEKMRVGETRTVKIENAFGEWKRENVKSLPLKEFLKSNIEPKPGMRVRIGNRLATVKRVGGGRVRVDLNHPYAGKTVVYEVTIKEKITDKQEKIKALIRRRMPDIPLEKTKITTSNEERIIIELPKEVLFADGVQFVKYGIANDLKRYLNFEEIIFVEKYGEELLGRS